jgi:hypothetical protein
MPTSAFFLQFGLGKHAVFPSNFRSELPTSVSWHVWFLSTLLVSRRYYTSLNQTFTVKNGGE